MARIWKTKRVPDTLIQKLVEPIGLTMRSHSSVCGIGAFPSRTRTRGGTQTLLAHMRRPLWPATPQVRGEHRRVSDRHVELWRTASTWQPDGNCGTPP